jgi:glycosyltransferase 2 family protein
VTTRHNWRHISPKSFVDPFESQGGLLSGLDKIAAKPRARNSWNWIGFALSLTIVGISAYVLANILRDVDFARVAGHIRSMPVSHIGWAILFIAGAYATLTCYDFFAVRTIGATHVPYRIAALASFTSYAIGHNIGATAFSGGAIRYRIYSQFGLGVVDVAKICFLTGLTFWLGNLAVLGGGIAYRPDVSGRIFQLPAEAMRVIGIMGLVLLCVYLAWASRRSRTIGIRNWTVLLPSGTSTLIQIGIGLADLGCSSLAMYSLLSSPFQSEPLTIMTAFVSATLLGFASHAPGSLGVFEAAMLVALPEVPKEELLAGLLIFRVLYFLIPFCFALVTMACWESALLLRNRAVARNRTAAIAAKLSARNTGLPGTRKETARKEKD